MSDDASVRRRKVLLVDTLSSANDFGVELPLALNPLVELTVFTIRGTRLRAADCHRLIVGFPEYWGARSKLAKLVDQLRSVRLLAHQLWLHRRGVVHVQFFRSMALELPLYLLMRPLLLRLVCTVHNVLPHEARPWHRAVYRLWYHQLDVLHVLSHHTAERLVREFGIPPGRILYAPHGNYTRFMRDHPPADTSVTRQGLGLAADDRLVLYCGQIRPYKGVDRLIEAAALVQSPRVLILAAGGCSAEAEQAMRQRMAALRLDPRRMQLQVGLLSNQAMSDLIAAADVMVFPYHHIYQSGALLLAMTFGKAIIASQLPGFSEYLLPDVTGVLCDTADPVVLASQIDRLAGDAKACAGLAVAARKAADTTYAWPVIAGTLSAAYGD